MQQNVSYLKFYFFKALFRQKLQLCCIIFDFEDAESDLKGKELKRETLVEIAEYVNTPSGQKIFTEALMPDIVQMVRVNILRLEIIQFINGIALLFVSSNLISTD